MKLHYLLLALACISISALQAYPQEDRIKELVSTNPTAWGLNEAQMLLKWAKKAHISTKRLQGADFAHSIQALENGIAARLAPQPQAAAPAQATPRLTPPPVPPRPALAVTPPPAPERITPPPAPADVAEAGPATPVTTEEQPIDMIKKEILARINTGTTPRQFEDIAMDIANLPETYEGFAPADALHAIQKELSDVLKEHMQTIPEKQPAAPHGLPVGLGTELREKAEQARRHHGPETAPADPRAVWQPNK